MLVLYGVILSASVVLQAEYGHCIVGKNGSTPPAPSYTVTLESELRRQIFKGYEVEQRPARNVRVMAALNLLSLNFLDIKEQKMSIAGYFHFRWNDSRLRWVHLNDYQNIVFLFTSEANIWTPAIIIENSIEHVDVISRPNVPLRIIKSGRVAWMPGGVFTTHCESDITYWPLDTQRCEINITSWSYTKQEVELAFDEKIFVITSYKENGEWELLGTNYSTVQTEREDEPFGRLTFTVTYRRRPLFHLLNTLFPVVLMGFITVAIFKLTPESGERVGLALTILLAYAVYLNLISDSIPQTSKSASLLSTYLASILLLQTMAVFLTVLYLDIYFRPETEPVPQWMQRITSGCLAKLVCIPNARASSRISPTSEEPGGTSTSSRELNADQPICDTKQGNGDDKATSKSTITWGLPMWKVNSDNQPTFGTKQVDGNTISMTKSNPNLSNPNMAKQQTNVVNDDVIEEQTTYSWKEIARMLDKLTMYVYLVLVVVFTCATFGMLVHHYRSAYMSIADTAGGTGRWTAG